jgi:BirA family transcriptional regulator, biotin operon repressor / biotin---[acetyl-CoA-carboxylase] ligase
MELYSILHLLADGEFHSGSELGVSLGVSRTAIWKAIGQLGSLDLELESVKGKGYRLARPLDLLSKAEMLRLLDEKASAKLAINVLLSAESTNTWLLARDGLKNQYEACFAEHQVNGKGRRGRSWVSPFASNLYLSVAFDLKGGAESLNGLSLVIGLSVVKALGQLGVKGVELKWPNDVWLNGRKLAGILVELHGEATTSWRVVVGVGLNVGMRAEEAKLIDQPWASLSEVSDLNKTCVAASLLNSLVSDLEIFKENGFGFFLERWAKYDALSDKDVEVNAGAMSGIARGVDRTGALLLETQRGLEVVNAGEVSVRTK